MSVATLGAVDWAALRPQGYLSDFAGVVDPQSKAALEQYCASIEHSTGVQLALVTVASLEREPIEDVARTIFDTWGIGRKGKNDGVLLLLAIADRRSHLYAGAGVKDRLPDALAASVLDDMRPALRENHYGEALLAAAQTIGAAVAQAKNVPAGSPPPRSAHQHSGGIPWLLILGGVALVAFLMRLGGQSAGFSGSSVLGFLPWLLLGNTLQRGTWGSRGSGGFGGFDSADTFGGFGGGESAGGGGVSSDW